MNIIKIRIKSSILFIKFFIMNKILSKVLSFNNYSYTLLIVILFCGNSCSNKTINKNELEGTWKSLSMNTMDFNLTFDKNNEYIANMQSKDLLIKASGKYEIHEDTLFIRDILNTPNISCSYNDTGIYIFKKTNDTIFFRPLIDKCEKRKLTFEIGLVKVKK